MDNMFICLCPRCNSDLIQPDKKRKGFFVCQNCNQTDIPADELKRLAVEIKVDPYKDPLNRPTVYGKPV